MAIKVQGTTVVDDSRNAEVVTLSINGTPVTATPTELNILDGATVTTAELNKLDGATVTTDELNILDGATVTTVELNKLDGATVTTDELNILDGATVTTDELNILDGATVTTAELNKLDGATVTTDELNILDGATVTTDELNILDGATVTTAELNKLDGATVTTDELNKLSGASVTTAELNFLSGVTGDVQTQIDNANTRATLTKSFASGETSTITLSQAITSGAPVVSVTKEVPQTGVTSNTWDVASDGVNYERHDTAYSTTLTPSNATGDGTFTLGVGSFASEDVGKTIEGNGGEAVLTATDGSYSLVTAFNDTSNIASGDWSMFGLDVESADAGLTLSGFDGDAYSLLSGSFTNTTASLPDTDAPGALYFRNDGLKLFVHNKSNGYIYGYNLTSAWDINTLTTPYSSFPANQGSSPYYGLFFKPDGTKAYNASRESDAVYQYSLSTAWDISTATYENKVLSTSTQTVSLTGIFFREDGLKLYVGCWETDSIYEYETDSAGAWELDTYSYTGRSFNVGSEQPTIFGLTFKPDGTEMFIVGNASDFADKYTLSSAWDISTASYSGESLALEAGQKRGLSFKNDGTRLFVLTEEKSLQEYSTQDIVRFTGANTTAITTASIDSEFWTDINSMTADDSVNDGAVYYAVSTDDRTTWSIIDDTNGVRNIVRNNAGTWEVNDASDYGTETWVAATKNDEFYALEEAVDVSTAQSVEPNGYQPISTWSYDNKTFSHTSEDGTGGGVAFNPSASKMYVVGKNPNDSVFQYTLSTEGDISTATYDSVSFNVSGQDASPEQIVFNNDGTKMFIAGESTDRVYEYDLSSGFDLSTASYNGTSLDVSSEGTTVTGVAFSDSGDVLFVIASSSDTIFQYSLSVPFDLGTASYTGVSFNASGQDNTPLQLAFNSDGTLLYVFGSSSVNIFEYVLSNPYDLSSISYSGNSFSVSSQNSSPNGISFFNFGTKLCLVGGANEVLYQYSTGEFINTSTNRMDATQLNGVSDGNHYTLGNDLDLAITLFMADGNTNSPTSDGVSINYDAQVKNEGAVLGIDYDFDFPANDVVRITSNATQNLKVRVV